jgi:hypothetical protein
MFGCGLTTRRVCVFRPARMARTISPLNRMGRSFMPLPRSFPSPRSCQITIASLSPIRLNGMSSSKSPSPPVGGAACRLACLG